MGFGDLKTRDGQQTLNNYLADKSYIDGFEPSNVDNLVFEALGVAPPGDLFHALRFFNHMNSFTEGERKAFKSSGKSVNDFGSAGETKIAVVEEKKADDDDDDVDLFGSETEEDKEQARIREERLAAYAAKKSKKPTLIAKSCVKLDIKPWDDETDLAEMEKCVKSVQMEGLVWGQFQLAPVAYGLKKLVASCVIEDDKVSTNELEEKILAFEDLVQSVDIVSFNKL